MLSAEQIEDSARFKIGDVVRIVGPKDWVNDWRNISCEIIGICWEPRIKMFNYTLAHDGNQVTDDFRIEDLERVTLAGRRALTEDTK